MRQRDKTLGAPADPKTTPLSRSKEDLAKEAKETKAAQEAYINSVTAQPKTIGWFDPEVLYELNNNMERLEKLLAPKGGVATDATISARIDEFKKLHAQFIELHKQIDSTGFYLDEKTGNPTTTPALDAKGNVVLSPLITKSANDLLDAMKRNLGAILEEKIKNPGYETKDENYARKATLKTRNELAEFTAVQSRIETLFYHVETELAEDRQRQNERAKKATLQPFTAPYKREFIRKYIEQVEKKSKHIHGQWFHSSPLQNLAMSIAVLEKMAEKGEKKPKYTKRIRKVKSTFMKLFDFNEELIRSGYYIDATLSEQARKDFLEQKKFDREKVKFNTPDEKKKDEADTAAAAKPIEKRTRTPSFENGKLQFSEQLLGMEALAGGIANPAKAVIKELTEIGTKFDKDSQEIQACETLFNEIIQFNGKKQNDIKVKLLEDQVAAFTKKTSDPSPVESKSSVLPGSDSESGSKTDKTAEENEILRHSLAQQTEDLQRVTQERASTQASFDSLIDQAANYKKLAEEKLKVKESESKSIADALQAERARLAMIEKQKEHAETLKNKLEQKDKQRSEKDDYQRALTIGKTDNIVRMIQGSEVMRNHIKSVYGFKGQDDATWKTLFETPDLLKRLVQVEVSANKQTDSKAQLQALRDVFALDRKLVNLGIQLPSLVIKATTKINCREASKALSMPEYTQPAEDGAGSRTVDFQLHKVLGESKEWASALEKKKSGPAQEQKLPDELFKQKYIEARMLELTNNPEIQWEAFQRYSLFIDGAPALAVKGFESLKDMNLASKKDKAVNLYLYVCNVVIACLEAEVKSLSESASKPRTKSIASIAASLFQSPPKDVTSDILKINEMIIIIKKISQKSDLHRTPDRLMASKVLSEISKLYDVIVQSPSKNTYDKIMALLVKQDVPIAEIANRETPSLRGAGGPL